jgi:hypothetical protein
LDISLTALSLVEAVEHDAPLRHPRLEEGIEDKVRAFFVEHIQALRAMSRGKDAPPPGRFIDSEAQSLFQSLHMGDTTEFLGSAGVLTKRLIGRMNHSTKRGLLACIRAEGPSERIGAVLKLEIISPTGATLEELASGEIRLAAVTNIMNQPGNLQKGALVANGMAAEEVLCGDTLNYQASYFPEAFGIQVFARPSRGSPALLNTIAGSGAQLARQVAETMPQVEPGPLREVVKTLGEHIPAFDPETQTGIIGTLENSQRPITYVNTQNEITAVIEQGGIIIKGSATVIHQDVQLRPDSAGGWEAVVRFENEPKITYR